MFRNLPKLTLAFFLFFSLLVVSIPSVSAQQYPPACLSAQTSNVAACNDANTKCKTDPLVIDKTKCTTTFNSCMDSARLKFLSCTTSEVNRCKSTNLSFARPGSDSSGCLPWYCTQGGAGLPGCASVTFVPTAPGTGRTTGNFCLAGSDFKQLCIDTSDPTAGINGLVNIATILGVFISVVMTGSGGLKIAANGANTDAKVKADGLEQIKNSLMGLGLILLARGAVYIAFTAIGIV